MEHSSQDMDQTLDLKILKKQKDPTKKASEATT